MTSDPFTYPSELANRGGVCQGQMTFYDAIDNYYPSSSTYYTVDILQSGACCAFGASRTGLSNPVTRLATGNWPFSGAASTVQPPRAFIVLARSMIFGSACPADKGPPISGAAAGEMCLGEENEGDVSISPATLSRASSADVEDKKGGGGSGRVGGTLPGSGIVVIQPAAGNRGATGGAGKASVGPQLMKLFGVPFVLVRHVKAAILPIENTTSEAGGKLKIMGANEAMIMVQNETTSAASMLRPLRLFSLALALTQPIGAGALPAENETAHSAEEVTIMGGNIYYLDNANRTSNTASGPRVPRIFSIPFALARHAKASVLKHQNGGP
ncbi:uncharacterized protein A1O5_05907 [Cladophialophora psammophila CBS 110553]|uniref:Uncharacterized protein n=1 Tax=Cladophialophora psammophila CBS 110553 TaxID=1182543 RepID=W9X0U5_9EURO|nr:uncharacterized protein A1O5_05907 [Cladophialophora psammophila CBS 110553]EXJ70915.1 hypothetical protein A1O5_05907 [Cladophialophora psammophila CBS 110553]